MATLTNTGPTAPTGLKTMLRGREDNGAMRQKKNVRFVTESVSSGYSSSEIDAVHMNMSPMSPMQQPSLNMMSSSSAPPPPPPADAGRNVFQYPNNQQSHRQLNFPPTLAKSNTLYHNQHHQQQQQQAQQLNMSNPLYFAPLPTIIEQQASVFSQSSVFSPPPSPLGVNCGSGGYEPFNPQMTDRWTRWTSLVWLHWPLLSQLDESARFDKICELSVVAAGQGSCYCNYCLNSLGYSN